MGRATRTIIRALGAVLVTAVGTLAVGAAGGPTGAQEAGDLCARFTPTEEATTVATGELVETSGLVSSRVHDEILWAHNDSGDQPRVFALGEDGGSLGTYAIEGAAAVDWEDIAVGPGPDEERSYLYVGDIGDNAAARTDVTVYRVPEPDAAPDGTDATLTGAEALRLAYPDGPADAEALLVDPVTGDLFVVTKVIDGVSTVLHAPADALVDGDPIALEAVGAVTVTDPGDVAGATYPGTLVTGADVSPDGSIVLLRTYKAVLAFARPDGGTIADALATDGCLAPSVGEPQAEAVAFTGAGDAYVTVSEIVPPDAPDPALPLHRFTVEPAAAPVADEAEEPATTAAGEGAPEGDASRGSTDDPDAPDAADDASPLPWLLAGVVVVVVAGGVLLLVRRARAG